MASAVTCSSRVCWATRPSVSNKTSFDFLFADGARRVRLSTSDASSYTWETITDFLEDKLKIVDITTNYGFFLVNGHNAKEEILTFEPSTVYTIYVKKLQPIFQDEPKEGSVPIHVKTMDSRVFTFYMNLEVDTVRDIMNKIELQEGIRAFFQSLIFRGKKMQEHLPLSHYELESNSILSFVLRLRTGPFVEVSLRDASLRSLPLVSIFDADKNIFTFGLQN
jgi:hypothetical protein